MGRVYFCTWISKSFIRLLVNKCLCLSLKYIGSKWLCCAYQLLTVGARINIPINLVFIYLDPFISGCVFLKIHCSVRLCVYVCACVCSHKIWYVFTRKRTLRIIFVPISNMYVKKMRVEAKTNSREVTNKSF